MAFMMLSPETLKFNDVVLKDVSSNYKDENTSGFKVLYDIDFSYALINYDLFWAMSFLLYVSLSYDFRLNRMTHKYIGIYLPIQFCFYLILYIQNYHNYFLINYYPVPTLDEFNYCMIETFTFMCEKFASKWFYFLAFNEVINIFM